MVFLDVWNKVAYLIRSWLTTLIATIDGLIYTADAEIYDLMIRIASTKVVTTETIESIAGRIYQLITLIMIFRIIFVSITYIMNPEAMTDKTKGYGNIVKKAIITLGLIIIVPWAFDQSRTIQAVILDDNVIEYFVFGQNDASRASTGYQFMFTLGKLFVHPYQCTPTGCKPYDIDKLKNSKNIKQVCTGNWENNTPGLEFYGKVITEGTANVGKCGYGLEGADNNLSYGITMYNVITPTGGKYDLQALFNLATYSDDADDKRKDLGWNWDSYAHYNYPVIGSTLVGLMCGYMLIVMCIDVAVRTIKLSFYEMIAPVPILSYIGPKDGKDTMLNKWFSQVLKTYGSLFIRVAGLQLACLFVTEMLENGLNSDGNIFVTLFLLIGILTFAKQAPQ